MKNKKAPLAAICVVAVLVVAVNIVCKSIAASAEAVTVTMPDLTLIQNGSYTGEYTLAPVFVKVSVAVSNHKMERIDILKHECGTGKRAETITGAVLENQTLSVDTVSGATVSSKCILKAIETALIK